jgi:hypothetical protein
MNKKNLLLSIPLATGIILTGCSDEEGQDDTSTVDDTTETETETNTGTSGDAEGTDSGNPASEEDNEGMLNEDPEDSDNGTDSSDLDEDESQEEE